MFIRDLASRISNRIQLTTDEYAVYPPAVKEAFGGLSFPARVSKSHSIRSAYSIDNAVQIVYSEHIRYA